MAALNLTAGGLHFSSLLTKTGPVFFSYCTFCFHEQVVLIFLLFLILILIQTPCPHEPNLSWCCLLSGLLEYLTAVLHLDISPGSPQLDLPLPLQFSSRLTHDLIFISAFLQRCDM